MSEIGRIDTQINHITNQFEDLSPVKNTPPSTTQNFTGQEKYLEKLHMHFNKNDNSGNRKMYLLHGMGGIGKTQICLKFKDEISEYYSHIFWIDSTSEETIDQSLKDIYKVNNMAMTSGVSYSADMTMLWISSLEEKWLMIFDNADGSPETVEKFIPPGNIGNILITSRNPEHKRIVSPSNTAEVVVMNEETAAGLLLKASGLNNSHEKYYNIASDIVKKLHYLPLAVDQAGAYISTGKCSIEKYIPVYDKYRLELMNNKNFRGASKYNKTVYGTWEISFQKILKMSEDEENEKNALAAKYAIRLMNICAFLHHENISDEIFERAAKHYEQHVKKYKDSIFPNFLPTIDRDLLNFDEYNNWNEIQYIESIGILLSFSLIKRTVNGKKFGLHPLVQTWCQDRLSLKEKNMWILNAGGILSSSIIEEQSTIEYIYEHNILLHIIQNLSHKNLQNMIYFHGTFKILAEIVNKNGIYDIEHQLRYIIFNEHKKLYGKENSDTLKSMRYLSNSYSNLGKYTEAEKLQIEVLEMSTKIVGQEHSDTLTSMLQLAESYRNLGKFTDAEILDNQVLEIRTRILGKEHPDTLHSMCNLATTYCNLGKFTDAEILDIQVLDMRIRILGEEHPDTLTSMSNLADTYRNLGKFVDAEILEIEVLEMRNRILGMEHPHTISSMGNLATTYCHLGKFTDAERLDIQVLDMRTKILGKEHPDTLTSMSNLADSYRNIGKFSDAEMLEIQVLEMRIRVLGKEHPHTLII
ncbi:P-loop containing nucleoside triphosphate hydrolase protein [Cyathus striatus]|nr:P-loop containing nucleoside triphosphate hydrolase protein [Cyathus striatus]